MAGKARLPLVLRVGFQGYQAGSPPWGGGEDVPCAWHGSPGQEVKPAGAPCPQGKASPAIRAPWPC